MNGFCSKNTYYFLSVHVLELTFPEFVLSTYSLVPAYYILDTTVGTGDTEINRKF